MYSSTVLLLVTMTHDFFGSLGLQPSALLVQARVPCWTCSAASWCRCLDLPGKLLARPRPAFIRMRTVSLSWEDEGKHHGHGLMRVLWSWWYYYRYYMICIIFIIWWYPILGCSQQSSRGFLLRQQGSLLFYRSNLQGGGKGRVFTQQATSIISQQTDGPYCQQTLGPSVAGLQAPELAAGLHCPAAHVPSGRVHE